MNDNSKPSGNLPLRVDFITSEQFPQLQKLGILTVSGEIDWERDLEPGLEYLQDFYKVAALVSFVGEGNLSTDQIHELEDECFYKEIALLNFSLEYASVPLSLKEFAECIREVIGGINYDTEVEKNIVIYRAGNSAIPGLTAACAIVVASDNKISGAQAVEMVRAAHKDAIETSEQERFVSLFGEYWKIYSKSLTDYYRQKQAATERVLRIAWFGDEVIIYRYKTPAGKWNFYHESMSIFPGAKEAIAFNYDPDKIPFWETELFGSLTEAMQSMSGEQFIFAAHPVFIHNEYRKEVKDYLENHYANLTDEQRERLQSDEHFSQTPERWLERADEEMRRLNQFNNRHDVIKDPMEVFTQDDSRNSRQLSDKHFLLCWKERSVLDAQNSPHPLDVVSSRQLNRVNAGDTIWIVTVNQDGELILAGRLKAAEVVDYLTAVRRLHDANLWDGDYYALAEEGTAEEINLTNLSERALELRFKNSGSDRLTITNGKIRAQQLGAMRELTAESAQMLTEIWENAVFDFGDDKFNDEDFSGEESGDDDYNFPDAVDVEIFEDIVRREPFNADAHYNLGVVRGQTGDLQGAMQSYRRAVELDPDYFAAWYNLGADHLETGNLHEAIECFDKAIMAKPDFAIAHFMKGAAYDRLDNHEAAIRSTRKGLEFAPDDAQAYHNLGNSYLRLGDARQAVDNFQRAAEIAPDDAHGEIGAMTKIKID